MEAIKDLLQLQDIFSGDYGLGFDVYKSDWTPYASSFVKPFTSGTNDFDDQFVKTYFKPSNGHLWILSRPNHHFGKKNVTKKLKQTKGSKPYFKNTCHPIIPVSCKKLNFNRPPMLNILHFVYK